MNLLSSLASKNKFVALRQSEIDTLNNLTNCISHARVYYDYYGGTQYEVNDVTDTHNCVMQYHDPNDTSLHIPGL